MVWNIHNNISIGVVTTPVWPETYNYWSSNIVSNIYNSIIIEIVTLSVWSETYPLPLFLSLSLSVWVASLSLYWYPLFLYGWFLSLYGYPLHLFLCMGIFSLSLCMGFLSLSVWAVFFSIYIYGYPLSLQPSSNKPFYLLHSCSCLNVFPIFFIPVSKSLSSNIPSVNQFWRFS